MWQAEVSGTAGVAGKSKWYSRCDRQKSVVQQVWQEEVSGTAGVAGRS